MVELNKKEQLPGLKPRFRFLFFMIFLIPAVFARAQERITINDPDLSFSYVLPEGYTYTDDPYFHYVYPKTGSKDHLPRLSLTYYDGYCPELDKCFDGKLNGDLRTKYSDFNEIKKENLIIDAARAIIGTYSFTESGHTLEGILCTFIKYDAYFVIEAQYLQNEKKMYSTDFMKIIKSIDVRKTG